MTTIGLLRAGALVLALEAIGIAALAAWQVVAWAGGDVGSPVSAAALLVMTVLAAVAVGAFAVATARGQSWGRSGGIVAQLLILAVALGALTGAYAHPLIALGLAAPAVLCVILLIGGARRAAAGERPPGDDAR